MYSAHILSIYIATNLGSLNPLLTFSFCAVYGTDKVKLAVSMANGCISIKHIIHKINHIFVTCALSLKPNTLSAILVAMNGTSTIPSAVL